jgi:Mrp family chromosome partitioning ATPase
MKLSNQSNGRVVSAVDEPQVPSPGVRRRDLAPVQRPGAGPFDELLCRLQARHDGKLAGHVTLGLIGCQGRAGVTTMAANLAVRASELGLGPVLLVETYRGGRSVGSAWGLSHRSGLVDLFRGTASFADCLQPGPAPDLQVLSAGMLRRGEIAVADATAVNSLLAEATALFAMVIFDLPPANRLRQALLLARRLDQALLVVRAESTRKHDAAKLAQRMVDDGLPLTGVLLNRQRRYVPRWMERWV